MATLSRSALLDAIKQRNERQLQEANAAGYTYIGDQLVKLPGADSALTPAEQEMDQIQLETARLNLQAAQEQAGDPLRRLATDERQRLLKLTDIQGQIDEFLKASDIVNTGDQGFDQAFERFAGLGGRESGFLAELSRLVTNPNKEVVQASRKLESERKAFAGNFARTLGGEAGVLTDVDIQRILGVLPSTSDTQADAQRKRSTLLGMLARGKQLLLDRARGFNPFYEPMSDDDFAQLGQAVGREAALESDSFNQVFNSPSAGQQIFNQATGGQWSIERIE